jgi:Peptidase family S41
MASPAHSSHYSAPGFVTGNPFQKRELTMRVLIWTVFGCATTLLCSGGAFADTSDSSAPQHKVQRTFNASAVASDLDTLYAGLQAGSFDFYAYTPKATLDREYRAIRAELEGDASPPSPAQSPHTDRAHPLTLVEAKKRLQLFAALAHQGHARVDGPYDDWAAYRKAGGKGFPIGLRIVTGRAYVAENLSGVTTIQPGDEILAMNSTPMPRWLERTARHISAETPYMAGSILEYDFPIYLWVDAGDIPTFDLVLRRDGKRTFNVRIQARTSAEMDKQRSTQPTVLDLEHPLRDARILDAETGYLRPGPFFNADAKTGADEWDVESFKHFIDASFQQFNAKGVSRLIIDLRDNPGGDSLFSDVMVTWLADRPFRFYSQFKIKVSSQTIAANETRIKQDAAAAGPVSLQYRELYAHAKPGDVVNFETPTTQPRAGYRFHGKVFVLIDRHTYSNAVAVAALIQDYRFGLILGEETADFATTYGAMEQFTLPSTGLSVGFPKARIIRPNGDTHARGVVPDIAITTPIVQASDDEVLRKAIEVAAQSK